MTVGRFLPGPPAALALAAIAAVAAVAAACVPAVPGARERRAPAATSTTMATPAPAVPTSTTLPRPALRWSPPVAVDREYPGGFVALSCASPSFCVGVAADGKYWVFRAPAVHQRVVRGGLVLYRSGAEGAGVLV